MFEPGYLSELKSIKVTLNGTDTSGERKFIIADDGEVTVPGIPVFRRGDVDRDNTLGLTDVLVLLGYLFLSGDPPGCADAADADDNGLLEITDAYAILGYLYLAADAPPEPGPLICGPDPEASEDDLTACVEAACADAN